MRSTAPFADLPREAFEELSSAVRLQRFRSQEVVFSEGEKASSSWMVYSGSAQILVYYSGARQLQMELLGRGQIFGLFCRLSGKRVSYPCTAVAKGPLKALRIPDVLFKDLYQQYASVARESCVLCSARLGSMQKLVSFGREAVDCRVAELLLKLSEIHGKSIPATRQQIALQTGAAIETVFRALREFRSKGWIATSRGSILLKNAAALEAHLKGRKA